MLPNDTRQSILSAAVLLMGRTGLDGLTASALAREVGVSKATVFHHFPKLDEVPIAALDVLAEMIIPADPDENADLIDLLRAFGTASLNIVTTQDGVIQAYFGFVTKAMFHPRLKAKLLAGMDAGVARFAIVLAGKTRDAEAAYELARLCLMTMDGLVLSAVLAGDASVQLALWERMAGLLAKEYGRESSD